MARGGYTSIEDIIWLCDGYKDLGWAVQEQLQDVVDGKDLSNDNLNINAAYMIRDFLDRCEMVVTDIDSFAEARERLEKAIEEGELHE